MSDSFAKVKSYLLDLDLEIVEEDPKEELVVAKNEERGLSNLVIDCEDPILIIEQLIMPVPQNVERGKFFERLLKMNRNLVHGAFVLDEDGKYVIFRDTLQLQNLDLNELEASILALEMALLDYGEELLMFSGH